MNGARWYTLALGESVLRTVSATDIRFYRERVKRNMTVNNRMPERMLLVKRARGQVDALIDPSVSDAAPACG